MDKDVFSRLKNHVLGGGTPKFPPAPEDAVRRAEARLAFNIPKLLRRIYLNIANGGFGPGYGVIGIEGGRPSNLGTLVDTCEQVKRGAEYLGLEWQAGLLPFCDWGCNIFSCVDCGDPLHHVFRSEECEAYPAGCTLEEFFKGWIEGAEVSAYGNEERTTAEIINPFTGKKFRITGGRKKKKE
jgi:hypothetical protein